MSERTDDLLCKLRNVKLEYPCDNGLRLAETTEGMAIGALAKEIAELETDIETLHTDLNTIVPELHNEIDKVKAERDKLRALLASKFSMDDKTKELCDIIKQDGIKPFICSTWPQEESNERTD